MNFLTDEIRKQLLRNGAMQAQLKGTREELDLVPVVKLFTPDAQCTWLLTEIDPDAPDIAFGLCDLGLGFPELGSVSLAELALLRGRLRLPIERDHCFRGKHPISVYSAAAHIAGRIVESDQALLRAAAAARARSG